MTVQNNLGSGLSVLGTAVVNLAGLTANGNGDVGVMVEGNKSNVVLSAPTIDGNAQQGVLQLGGTLALTGPGEVSQNGVTSNVAGIRAQAGTLTASQLTVQGRTACMESTWSAPRPRSTS